MKLRVEYNVLRCIFKPFSQPVKIIANKNQSNQIQQVSYAIEALAFELNKVLNRKGYLQVHEENVRITK